MKENKMKSRRKEIKNRQWIIGIGVLIMIAIAIFFWNLVAYDKEKNSLGGVKARTGLDQGQLTFISPDSTQKESILIEIAEDDYSRANGLMYREDLAENQGMLFIFDEERQQYFWMKNTPVSLDMIFVNKEHHIVNIRKYTMPFSTKSYGSTGPALYVVEVVAGYCDQRGIDSGWSIEWKRY
ncbi:MAG: DUF192 domain-containing protein [Calditrichaceae bacterium]|jgi:uncharacterized membrane protein (UPF0127 family)